MYGYGNVPQSKNGIVYHMYDKDAKNTLNVTEKNHLTQISCTVPTPSSAVGAKASLRI